MTAVPSPFPGSGCESARGAALLAQYEHNIFRRTDRLFLWLQPAQWLGGILRALFISRSGLDRGR
jgi:hypothetical protein